MRHFWFFVDGLSVVECMLIGVLIGIGIIALL